MSLEAVMQDLASKIELNTQVQQSLLAKLLGEKAPKAAEKGDEATDSAPATRRRRTSEKAPEEATPTPSAASGKDDAKVIYSVVKAFINYGEDGDEESEDERELRGKFITKMNNHFDVERASQIPSKNAPAVKRWIKMYENGEKVDFAVD